MKLPSHHIPKEIQLPLILEGMHWTALSGWYAFYARRGNVEKCREINAIVDKLLAEDQCYIKKLSYYKHN